MLTDRFRALADEIAKLPPSVQDALAAAIEDALRKRPTPPLAPDVRAAMDRALEQHAASLLYLKDR